MENPSLLGKVSGFLDIYVGEVNGDNVSNFFGIGFVTKSHWIDEATMSHASGIQDYQRSKPSFPEAEACCSEMLRATAKKIKKEVVITYEQTRNKNNKKLGFVNPVCETCAVLCMRHPANISVLHVVLWKRNVFGSSFLGAWLPNDAVN